MRSLQTILCAIAFTAYSAASVSAYIDPGTAGMIASTSLAPLLAAAGAILAGVLLKFTNPIKKGVKLLWQKLKG